MSSDREQAERIRALYGNVPAGAAVMLFGVASVAAGVLYLAPGRLPQLQLWTGVSLAIFTDPTGPDLETAWLAEYYETGARTGRKVESVETTQFRVSDGIVGQRVDALNGESFQTVVVWERNGQMAVVVVADFIREIQTREAHDAVVRQAVDAFGT